MTTYIALLRGVNVGGKNRMNMAELRQALEAAGLAPVETYIQSGNIIFESEQGEAELRQLIARQIAERFGLATPVILRSAVELAQLVAACPFSAAEIARMQEINSEGESFYAALLAAALTAAELAALERLHGAEECLAARGRDLYLLLPGSIRNSRLAGKLQRLPQPATLRNWQTVTRLLALAQERNSR